MAYAVLASLSTTTHKILQILLDPSYPYIVPCNRQTIESLQNSVEFFLSFLENSQPHKYQTIVANIRDVAYQAEDILESHLAKYVRSIYKRYYDDIVFNLRNLLEMDEYDGTNVTDENDEIAANMLCGALEEVMEGFQFLMEDVKEIQTTANFGDIVVEQMSSLSVASSSIPPVASTRKNNFILLDVDFMNQIKEQLVSVESLLKVIPIVGMGGIGKTTLAKALIDDSLTSSHFDVRGWVTISQEYSTLDVVEKLLKDITGEDRKYATLSESTERLHKTLFGRRYLVVLDDLWDIEACDDLQRLFPDCKNGSRIMVTTRQLGVATFAAKSYHDMKLLNGSTSWDLLRQEVGNNCPPELTEIGKEIAMKCNGLPLTISVIGGLLSKGKMTRDHWEHVADNMKSVLTEEGDRCSEILSLSYNHLPHHLKACFLYLGIYPEDYTIPVSEPLQLWVAEGFLKPGPTNMEKVAEENLKDLIKRNLILVEKVAYNEKPELCKIHDLLRDLCIKEAAKENIFHVWDEHTDFNCEETYGHRRLSILSSYSKGKGEFDMKKSSMPGNRSLMCFANDYIFESNGNELLRVLKHKDYDSDLNYELSELANLRWISFERAREIKSKSGATWIFDLWDLQYLSIRFYIFEDKLPDLPLYIWFMPQLRHLSVANTRLPPLPPKTKTLCVLKRLELLDGIYDIRFDDELLVRIPNLRILILYLFGNEVSDWYLFNNLVNMSKLEILDCLFDFCIPTTDILVGSISFPNSLKKLTLIHSMISWEHIDQIIGELPNLEWLGLGYKAFVGSVWETSEDHFKKLEYLWIYSAELNEWIVEDSNRFPSLRHLFLLCCTDLTEIPTCIGEIPTLETIKLDGCSEDVVSSAKSIQDDYNNDIKLIIGEKTRYAYEDEEEE